jgi:hypothetical protein
MTGAPALRRIYARDRKAMRDLATQMANGHFAGANAKALVKLGRDILVLLDEVETLENRRNYVPAGVGAPR